MHTVEVGELLISKIITISGGRLSRSNINNNSALIDDLKLDSLDFATVLLSTEKDLGVKISESNINWREVRTVEQLANLFTTRIQ